MIILGVDPALNNCGWAVVENNDKNNSIVYIASGVIKNNSSLKNISYIEKIKVIIDTVDEIVLKYKPDVLSIEETFVNNNAVTSLKLGVIRGAVIAICLRRNLIIKEFSPNEIKKIITGNGRADKMQVQYMVKTLLPKVSTKLFDESDAIAIAISGIFDYKK